MSFFEPPRPPPEPPEPHALPPWHGPPDGVLAGVVGLELLVARSDDTVVAVSGIAAYPQGFGFRLSIRRRRPSLDGQPDPFEPAFPPWRARASAQALRFGIQFADGRKATNVRGAPFDPEAGEPAGPVLMPGGGGGGPARWDQDHWVWPLPPAGPLAFVCEWPAEGIPLTRVEIDAGLVLEAAGRAVTLWDDPPDTGGGSWSSVGVAYLRAEAKDPPPPDPEAL